MTITKVIDVYADGCPPCKAMEPILEKLEKNYHIPVEKVNAETHEEFVSHHNIRGVPTFFVMDGDNIVHRLLGYHSYDELTKELELV